MPAPKTVAVELIPETLEGVADLLTARKAQKAATVWAHFSPGKNTPDGKKSYEEGEKLGITGLLTRKSFRYYRDQYQGAIDRGIAPRVKPGDPLPTGLPWPLVPEADEKPNDGRSAQERMHTDTLITQMVNTVTLLRQRVSQGMSASQRKKLVEAKEGIEATLAVLDGEQLKAAG